MITKREYECLVMRANGYLSKEVAHELGIHQRTVEAHLNSAREKLKSSTTVQAVARAIKLGVIHLGEISLILLTLWSVVSNAEIESRRPPRPLRIVRTVRKGSDGPGTRLA